jgi:thioredoxin-related protein
MQRTTFLRLAIISAIFASIQSPRANAQEVAWKRDYSSARREATETGKPILLDFGTEACGWCRKQDATTFRDPRVIKLLNERFIAVKIDADRDPRLAQSLSIESYPTMVLASAEGKVLARQVGYADAEKLLAMLGKAPAKSEVAMATPLRPAPAPASGPMAEARADYDAKRYAECLLRCNQIVATNPITPDAQAARALIEQISADPQAAQVIKVRIEANLVSLQPKLAAALER